MTNWLKLKKSIEDDIRLHDKSVSHILKDNSETKTEKQSHLDRLEAFRECNLDTLEIMINIEKSKRKINYENNPIKKIRKSKNISI